MRIGERIKFLAGERCVTQKQIAEATGVTQAFISAIYTGKKIPSLEMLMELCQVLSVTPNTMLEVDDGKPNSSLSSTEDELLTKYRFLSPRDKEAVIGLINSLSKPYVKEDALIWRNGSDVIGDSEIG